MGNEQHLQARKPKRFIPSICNLLRVMIEPLLKKTSYCTHWTLRPFQAPTDTATSFTRECYNLLFS